MLHAVVIFLVSIAVDPHHRFASSETPNSESILSSTYAVLILFSQLVFLFFPFIIPDIEWSVNILCCSLGTVSLLCHVFTLGRS